VVEGYPALVDEGDAVAVRVLSRPEAAERAMAGGIRRLVLRAVPVGVRGLEREIPDAVRRALVVLPDITVGALLRDVITASATTIVADHGGPTWTEAGFAAVVAGARADLRSTSSRTLRDAGRVLVEAAEVVPALDRLTAPTLAASVADARAHLARLVRPGFVTTAGPARLPDVARYVRGIGARLAKLPEAPGRDGARLVEVAALERSYQQLLGALSATQVTARVVAAGWMLEELRVSLFAQALGTRVAVSPRRVASELESLWSGDLD
jgi:ATP-dependent helicase HrpA